MIQYVDGGDLAIFDGLSFRLDKKQGYYRNAKTRKCLHVCVWEHFNGQVPKGFHVHHIDFNKANNEIENLKLLPQKEHLKLHGEALTDEQREWRRKNLLNNATSKAAEWHKSEAGAEWHRAHYELTKDALHKPRKFACQYCGNEFESSQAKSRYCSGKCASAARRESGVDNVTKICERCGKEYVSNKYQKTKYCSQSCRDSSGRDRRRLQHGSDGNS